MTESTTVESSAPAAAPLKKVVKKVAPKASTNGKAVVKKVASKSPAKKASSNGQVKKTPVKPDALRNPQIEILKLLKKKANGLTRSQISEMLKADGKTANLSEMIGSVGGSNKWTTTLVERKHVKIESHEDGEYVIITATGLKALESALKAAV